VTLGRGPGDGRRHLLRCDPVSESNETEIPRSNAQAEKPDQTANEQEVKVEHANRQQ